MKLRQDGPFLIDYDGVIADTNSIKAQWIKENCGLTVDPALCNRSDCVDIIGPEAYERLSDYAYEEEASRKANPMEGVHEGISKLSEKWRLVVATARKPHRVPFAKRWLADHDLAGYFEHVISSVDKLALATGLGAVALLDDDFRHLKCPGYPEIARFHLLTNLEVNFRIDSNVHQVQSWKALTNELLEL